MDVCIHPDSLVFAFSVVEVEGGYFDPYTRVLHELFVAFGRPFLQENIRDLDHVLCLFLVVVNLFDDRL